MFFLIAALRYNIGGDPVNFSYNWHKYPIMFSDGWYEQYKHLKVGRTFIYRYQPGWVYFAMLVRAINPSFVTLQIVLSLILNIAVFRTIKKYSKYSFLSLFVYYLTFTFFLFEFEVLRESLAVSIFLLFGFDNWLKKKWVKYLIAVTLAYLIHPSALLMYVFPLFRYLDKLSTKTFLLGFILPVLFIAIVGRLVFANLMSAYLASDELMSGYADRALDREFNSNFIYPRLLDPALFTAIIIIWRNRIRKEYIPLIVYVTMLLIMVLYDFDMLRFANYIIIPAYIAITPVLRHLILKYRTMWVGVLLIIIYNIPHYMVQFYDDRTISRYIPYQNVLFPEQTPTQKRYWRPISQ